jgi:outer membrane protein OmpA-like peptidoglycan-associated protein
MSRSRLWLLPFVVLMAQPAFAQIGGTPIELSGQVGLMNPDTRAHMKAGPAAGASFGYRFQPWLVVEAQGIFSRSEADTSPEQTQSFGAAGLDLRLNLRPAESRVVPFLTGGFGYGRSRVTSLPPEQLERGAPTLALGVLFNVLGDRTYLRLQARDVFFRERDAKEFSQHLSATAGLHFVWLGKVRDSDLDGVRDWQDRCPDTPLGATVDAHGCPSDGDHDGVFDGVDKCPDTPTGCPVDARGCPKDDDGDGVCNGLDQCADTPKGATVDGSGCPKDSDGDQVLDGLDQCAETGKGCTVDEKGCPKDSDGDGVCDGRDQCPDTTPGLRVDSEGCPIEVQEKETELLDTGMIRLQNVNFETGKSTVLAESYPVLAVVGQVLSKWPELMIEIGGHTDARGSEGANQKLSEGRAEAVRQYLVEKFPGLKPEQFTAKGYGESRPLVPNTSALNWAKNRRVEFVVKNKEVLKREVERRRLLKRGEGLPSPGAPSDTLRSVPAPSDTLRSVPAPSDTLRPVPAPPDTLRPVPAPPDTLSPR